MNYNFGVGFTFKDIAVFNEFFFENVVVFDDAVVDERNFSIHGGVWVRVYIGRLTVSCPTGMADSGMTTSVLFCGKILQVLNFAYAFVHVKRAIVQKSNASAVVAAVF